MLCPHSHSHTHTTYAVHTHDMCMPHAHPRAAHTQRLCASPAITTAQRTPPRPPTPRRRFARGLHQRLPFDHGLTENTSQGRVAPLSPEPPPIQLRTWPSTLLLLPFCARCSSSGQASAGPSERNSSALRYAMRRIASLNGETPSQLVLAGQATAAQQLALCGLKLHVTSAPSDLNEYHKSRWFGRNEHRRVRPRTPAQP
jgi:hypothetical protein